MSGVFWRRQFSRKEGVAMTATWHKTNYRVPYSDTDRMGVVHHANYINWFEIARTECMRYYGVAYSDVEASGLLLPVVDVACSYKNSATFDDCIAIYSKIVDYSPIKLAFAYEARKVTEEAFAKNDEPAVDEPMGELLTTGTTKHMWVNHDFKPTRLSRKAPKFYEVVERYGGRE